MEGSVDAEVKVDSAERLAGLQKSQPAWTGAGEKGEGVVPKENNMIHMTRKAMLAARGYYYKRVDSLESSKSVEQWKKKMHANGGK